MERDTEKVLGTVPQTAQESGDILSEDFRGFKTPLSSKIFCQEQQLTSCFDTEQLITWLFGLSVGWKNEPAEPWVESGIIFRLWRNSFSPCIQHNIKEQSIDIVEIHSFKSLRFFPFWLLGMQGKAATKTRWIHSCLLNFCSLCKTYKFSGSKPAGNPPWRVHLISHVLLQFFNLML